MNDFESLSDNSKIIMSNIIYELLTDEVKEQYKDKIIVSDLVGDDLVVLEKDNQDNNPQEGYGQFISTLTSNFKVRKIKKGLRYFIECVEERLIYLGYTSTKYPSIIYKIPKRYVPKEIYNKITDTWSDISESDSQFIKDYIYAKI